jgi:hypothetical protein
MIVRVLSDRLQLVRQPDHAHLARSIAERFVALASHPRRAAILRATGEHDAAWAELDAAPVVDAESGAVLDFVRLPVRDRQAVWPRSVALLADDPWAAALVARHALNAYDRFRGEAEWAAFFAEMEELRDAHLEASDLGPDQLAADYAFVRLFDLLSLAFCTGWPDEQRWAEWTVRPMGERVLVVPDPFAGAEVPVEVEAREVGGTRFASDEELRDALRGARAITLDGVVAGG